MSRQAQRLVEFETDGQLVQIMTDTETARAIGMYKDVCNKIGSFDVAFRISETPDGSIREILSAQSHRLRIVCIKEYVPNVPDFLDGAKYECGILNKKSDEVEVVANDKFDRYYGGVPMLYYKLLRGRVK